MRGIIADCNFSGNSNTLNLNGGTTKEYITANAQSVKDGHNNFVI